MQPPSVSDYQAQVRRTLRKSVKKSYTNLIKTKIIPMGREILNSLQGTNAQKLAKIMATVRELRDVILKERGPISVFLKRYFDDIGKIDKTPNPSLLNILTQYSLHYYLSNHFVEMVWNTMNMLAAYQYAAMVLTNEDVRVANIAAQERLAARATAAAAATMEAAAPYPQLTIRNEESTSQMYGPPPPALGTSNGFGGAPQFFPNAQPIRQSSVRTRRRGRRIKQRASTRRRR
jgi:hypothetical protein